MSRLTFNFQLSRFLSVLSVLSRHQKRNQLFAKIVRSMNIHLQRKVLTFIQSINFLFPRSSLSFSVRIPCSLQRPPIPSPSFFTVFFNFSRIHPLDFLLLCLLFSLFVPARDTRSILAFPSPRHQKVRKLNWRNWIFRPGARNQMIPAVEPR